MQNSDIIWQLVDAKREAFEALSDRVFDMPEIAYTEFRSVAEHKAELERQGFRITENLAGIPTDARAGKPHGFLKAAGITPAILAKIERLNAVAQARGQSLAQMALAWVLRDPRITTALIGASKVSQLENNLAALANLAFAPAELAQIDAILG